MRAESILGSAVGSAPHILVSSLVAPYIDGLAFTNALRRRGGFAAVDDAWRARVPAELDGEPVQFLGWDHLLDNKRASDRTKDRADVEKLLAVARRKGAG